MEEVDLEKLVSEIEALVKLDEPEEVEQPRNVFKDFIVRLLWDYRGIVISLGMMYDIT
jgi:hypothetical protein